jgi:integrase
VVDRPLLWCLLRLAATTGARRGQLLALQWRDIDLDRGVIAFTRALVVGPDGPVLGATKTDATYWTDLDAESVRRCCAVVALLPSSERRQPAYRCLVRPTCSRMTSTVAGRGHRIGPPSSSRRSPLGRSASLPSA